jgi:hypothetical protein
MHNFQDWLNCKLYSTHLRNLIKIKEDTICMKAEHQKNKTNKNNNFNQNFSSLHLSDRRPSAQMKATPKQEQRELQLIRDNLNFVNRLSQVSPVISKDKQIQSYHKNQSLFKKAGNSRHFEQLKARNFRSFLKNQEENFLMGVHRSIVRITLQAIPRVPEGQPTTLWLELLSGL